MILNNIPIQDPLLNSIFYSFQTYPQIIGVEDFEGFYTLEIVYVLSRYL